MCNCKPGLIRQSGGVRIHHPACNFNATCLARHIVGTPDSEIHYLSSEPDIFSDDLDLTEEVDFHAEWAHACDELFSDSLAIAG
jgi:hypothetical protein